jgi:hypothetical protein
VLLASRQKSVYISARVIAGVVRPVELSAVLSVCTGVSLEVTLHEAMFEVDHVSVVELPGWTRLGVAVSAELMEPEGMVTVHEP